VADDVVLVSEDVLRLLRLERLEAPLRHREGIVREVDPLLLLVPLIHREIDDPAKGELVLVTKTKLIADLHPRLTGKGGELLGQARHEEHGIAVGKLELGLDGFGALRPDILGDRACAFAFAEENIAEPRLPLGLRPSIHAVAESAAAAALRGDRPDA